MRIDEFNQLPSDEAQALICTCCGCIRWARDVVAARPFNSVEQVIDVARSAWADASRDEILEAFSHHPRIGADVEQLRAKFARTADLSAGEQAGVGTASEETLQALRDGNLNYEKRFGFIFIVCATGKSAEEMLGLLEARLNNDPSVELSTAAGEQAKITEIRLRGLFS